MMQVEDIDWNNISQYDDILCLPDEVWVIANVVSANKISNYGRMMSLVQKVPKIRKISDNGAGYKKWALSYNREDGKPHTKNYYVHRLVAEHFLDNPNNLPQVNHTREGFGKHDNRATVLEWCTEKENIRDAHDNGQMYNRTVVHTKVDRKSDEFVSEMYCMYKDTGKVGETARHFGISRTTLSSIVNKRSRKEITNRIDRIYEQRKLDSVK